MQVYTEGTYKHLPGSVFNLQMTEREKAGENGRSRKSSIGGGDKWSKAEILRLLGVMTAYAPRHFLSIKEPVRPHPSLSASQSESTKFWKA